MSRSDGEKVLVDAIIDGEVDARSLAQRAAEMGATLGERLTTLTKGILQCVKDGKMTAKKASETYREAYAQLALLGFAKIAQEVLTTVDEDVVKLREALNGLGKDIMKVQVIRKADKLQREMEKRGETPRGAPEQVPNG